MGYLLPEDMVDIKRSFYIYRHIRLDTNEPFYIGIGTIGRTDKGYYRANVVKARNKIWGRIASKTEFEIEIVLDNMLLEEAKQKEIEFIKLYGRKDNHTGILANMTNGGDGVWGLKMSEESKKKISEKKKGIKASPETRALLSKLRRGKKFTQKKGRKMSEQCRIKHAIRMKGNKHGLGHVKSEEVKSKISIASSSRKHSDESKIKIGLAGLGRILYGKGICSVYKDGVFIKKYRTVEQAGKSLRIFPQNINKVLTGQRHHAGGYTFKR